MRFKIKSFGHWHLRWFVLYRLNICFSKVLIFFKVACFVRKRVFIQKVNNLIHLCFRYALTSTKLLGFNQMHTSIIKRQLSHDTITEFNIKDVIIFTSCEELITWIIFCLLDCTHVWAHVSILINNFADFLPFLLRYLPHVCFCHSLIFKDFDFTLRITIEFSFHLRFKIRKVLQIRTALWLRSTFAIRIIFFILAASVLSRGVSCESFERLVFTADNDVAHLVVCERPDCPRHLDSLFTFPSIPYFNCAIISCWNDLSSFQSINCKNKSCVSFIVNEMSAIKRP